MRPASRTDTASRNLVICVLLAACSSGASHASADGNSDGTEGRPSSDAGAVGNPGGAGTTGAAGAMGGAGATTGTSGASGNGACNSLPNPAPFVFGVDVSTAPPAGKGGSPAPGIYYLTEWDWYTGPGGATTHLGVALGETVELTVAGNVVTLQIAQNDGPVTTNGHQTLVLTLSGTTTADLQMPCPPSTGHGPVPYTATATTFELVFGGQRYMYTKESGGPIDLVAACKKIQDEYAVSLRTAETCDPTASSQCQSTTFTLELGCELNCEIAVQDSSPVSATAERWATGGCDSLPGYTCSTVCPGPEGHCMAQVGGTGLCVTP